MVATMALGAGLSTCSQATLHLVEFFSLFFRVFIQRRFATDTSSPTCLFVPFTFVTLTSQPYAPHRERPCRCPPRYLWTRPRRSPSNSRANNTVGELRLHLYELLTYLLPRLQGIKPGHALYDSPDEGSQPAEFRAGRRKHRSTERGGLWGKFFIFFAL